MKFDFASQRKTIIFLILILIVPALLALPFVLIGYIFKLHYDFKYKQLRSIHILKVKGK